MAVRTRELMVGLFVTFGLLVGIGGVVWLGASEVLKKGALYVSYFDQSVGAISSGSPVKYMGLEVGSVRRIEVAPDPNLMAVVMKIRRSQLVTERTVCEIQTLGFTGVGYIELLQRRPGEAGNPPELSFEPELPVIPSRPSAGMASIMDQAGDFMARLRSLDIEGVVSNVNATVRSADDLVSSPALKHTVDNVAEVSRTLDDVASRLDRMVASDDFAHIPGETEQTLADARLLLADARKQIESLQLAQTSKEVDHLVSDVDDRSQVVSAQVEELLQDLRQAVNSLDRLLERLENDPSQLIFGKPAPRRGER